jgi:hypothetical protein
MGVKGAPNSMKSVFKGILQKNGKSYKLQSCMAGMIGISAANHMT